MIVRSIWYILLAYRSWAINLSDRKLNLSLQLSVFFFSWFVHVPLLIHSLSLSAPLLLSPGAMKDRGWKHKLTTESEWQTEAERRGKWRDRPCKTDGEKQIVSDIDLVIPVLLSGNFNLPTVWDEEMQEKGRAKGVAKWWWQRRSSAIQWCWEMLHQGVVLFHRYTIYHVETLDPARSKYKNNNIQ